MEKKLTVYNLIILDKSGSMTSIASEAISGVNETIGTIRAASLKDSEVEQRLTLVAFCSCGVRYIFDNVPIGEAHPITAKDYQPCCGTPLLDAIGTSVNKLKSSTEAEAGNKAYSVTIITDGYENASQEYSGATALSFKLKNQA